MRYAVSRDGWRANEKEKPKAPLSLGDVVADKYRVESLLGEGGMGFVFAALHLQLGHRVALKVLNSLALTDREVTERFLREGRAVARLQGEHVARVSDVGTARDGRAATSSWSSSRAATSPRSSRRAARCPLAEVVEYVAQACEALAEAHVRGIVHRDLKPANLFLLQKLDGEPLVKVLDFGISKITVERRGRRSTPTTSRSPRRSSARRSTCRRSRSRTVARVDSRTDIWGLGTIFYELLTQNRPFAAPSLALVCVKILHDEVPRAEQHPRGHPAGRRRDHRALPQETAGAIATPASASSSKRSFRSATRTCARRRRASRASSRRARAPRSSARTRAGAFPASAHAVDHQRGLEPAHRAHARRRSASSRRKTRR